MKWIDRVLSVVWDVRGERRVQQDTRLRSTHTKILRLEATQRRAAKQVQRTQQFVTEHREEWQ